MRFDQEEIIWLEEHGFVLDEEFEEDVYGLKTSRGHIMMYYNGYGDPYLNVDVSHDEKFVLYSFNVPNVESIICFLGILESKNEPN